MSAAPFITTDDLSDMLGRDVHANGGTIAIDSACDLIRTLTGQTLNAGTTTAVFDGTGTDALVLPEFPTTRVLSVAVRDAATPGAWNTAGTADYALASSGVLMASNVSGTAVFGTTWPIGRQNVQVRYVHGWEPDAMPRDIRMVALSVAERIVLQGPLQSESQASVSATFASPQLDLTTGEKQIVAKYRRTRPS